MMIVWSLPGGNYHPIRLRIFTKLYPGAPLRHPIQASASAILLDSIRAQGRKAEIAPVSTKMKPGARILRTIA
jgi:hypothetical protein